MCSFILQVVIGIIVIIIGIFNSMGNISLLHFYHRKRVKQEDIIPFGKKVGLGSIIIGSSIIIAGIFSILNELLSNTIYIYISNIILAIGFIIGLITIFYAMFKYNKGIF